MPTEPKGKKPPAKRPPDDPEEYARFLEAAKAAEASDDPKELEKAFKKVAPAKSLLPKR